MTRLLKTDALSCLNSRQYRQTVTEYVKDTFETFCFYDPNDRLNAYLGLHKAFNAIAENEFVYRDLSWGNMIPLSLSQ